MADQVKFDVFRGQFITWNKLFQQAAAFAGSIGKDRVISISHSSQELEGVVTVWYWSDEKTNILELEEND